MSSYATRPKTFEELDSWDQAPREFLNLDTGLITTDTAVGAAALHLIEACRNSPYFDVLEKGGFRVMQPKTEAEQEQALQDAQKAFDVQSEYLQDVRNGVPIQSWMKYTVENSAKARGITDLPEIIVKED